MAARITAGLALGSSLLLVAALVAVTPAQNRFDFARAGAVRPTQGAPVSVIGTNPAGLATSSSRADHVNRFSVDRLRTPAAPRRPVIRTRSSMAVGEARGTLPVTSRPAPAVRSNAFRVQPTATVPAARSRSEAGRGEAPIRIVTNWGGRSIRISPRAPVSAPAARNGSANQGSAVATTNRGLDDEVEPRLNYWDRRRWDPCYLSGWCYCEALYPSPYVD